MTALPVRHTGLSNPGQVGEPRLAANPPEDQKVLGENSTMHSTVISDAHRSGQGKLAGGQASLKQLPDILVFVPSRSTKPPTKPPKTKTQRWPIDEAWKQRVLAELASRQWSQSDLARLVKSSQAAISLVLASGTDSSKLVPDIHRVFGWEPPRSASAPRTELQQRWEEAYERLLTTSGEGAIEAVLRLAEQLHAKK